MFIDTESIADRRKNPTGTLNCELSLQLIKGVCFDFGTVKGGAHGNLYPLSYPVQPINWSESFSIAPDPGWSAPADNPYAKPTENLLARPTLVYRQDDDIHYLTYGWVDKRAETSVLESNWTNAAGEPVHGSEPYQAMNGYQVRVSYLPASSSTQSRDFRFPLKNDYGYDCGEEKLVNRFAAYINTKINPAQLYRCEGSEYSNTCRK